MRPEENLERDREFVREFEAAIEADLAQGRASLRRYAAHQAIAAAAAYVVLLGLGALMHQSLDGAFGGVLASVFISTAAKSGLDDIRRRAADKLQGAKDPRLAGVLSKHGLSRSPVIRKAALRGLARALPNVGR